MEGSPASTVADRCQMIGGGDGGTSARAGCYFYNDPDISERTKMYVGLGGFALMTGGTALTMLPAEVLVVLGASGPIIEVTCAANDLPCIPLRRPRVRHHTTPEYNDSIKADQAINPSRGGGVHVEVEPFGPARTAGREVGVADPDRTNSYVEFDAPQNMEPTGWKGQPRNTAVIPTDTPLPLKDLNPKFVKRPWWKFWGD